MPKTANFLRITRTASNGAITVKDALTKMKQKIRIRKRKED